MPLLDLHGYQERPAIRALTDFLEEHKNINSNSPRNRRHGTWVRVITGTGSHSTRGPILRPAVQSLFERRQMTFTMDTPASFCVDAASGVTFYASSAHGSAGRHNNHEPRIQVVSSNDPPPEGVVVVGRPVSFAPTTTAAAPQPAPATATVSAEDAASVPTAACEHRSISCLGDYIPAAAHSTTTATTTTTTSSTTTTGGTNNNSSLSSSRRISASSIVNTWWQHNSDDDPRQTYSNPEMEQVAQAREASLAEAAAAPPPSRATLKDDSLEEVLALSRKEYERQELDDYKKGKSCVDDEDADLGQALAFSRNEYEKHVVHEEAAVQKAIDLSKQQEEAERKREERLLQAALQQSQQEIREMMRQQKEEEAMLHAALQESEKVAKDDGIDEEEKAVKEALAKSLEETERRKRAAEEEDERLLQQVMQMSLEY